MELSGSLDVWRGLLEHVEMFFFQDFPGLNGKVDFGICHFALRWAPLNKLQSWNHQTVNHLSVISANQSLCDCSFSYFSTFCFANFSQLLTSHFWPTASVSAQTIIKHCGTRGQRSCLSQSATTNDMRACVHFLQTAMLHYESFSTWSYKCKSSLISRTLNLHLFCPFQARMGLSGHTDIYLLNDMDCGVPENR